MQTKQGSDLADDGPRDHRIKDAKVVGLAAGLGISVVASLIFFIGLGIVLDQWLDMTPVLTLAGVALGLGAAGYQLYELVLASDSKRENGPLARTMARRIEGGKRNRMRNDAGPR